MNAFGNCKLISEPGLPAKVEEVVLAVAYCNLKGLQTHSLPVEELVHSEE